MLQDSWGVSTSIGWNFGGLQVSVGGGWSRTEGQTFSQEITITIQPGEMVRSTIDLQSSIDRNTHDVTRFQGVLVANVQFRRMQGNMKIGSKFVCLLTLSIFDD